ncbi:MAG: OmpA family protein [Candidatus Latescibacterota bacterium]|nr:OmpA family protein [Candidatus Latescibacterota bacterium]
MGRSSTLLLGALLLLPAIDAGAFTPPRIVGVINQTDSGSRTAAQLADRRYVIDKGQVHSINRADVLNVYRETRMSRRIPVPLRLFIGTMTITDAQQQSSIGVFTPNANVMSQSVIKYKTAVKGDIVVPRLILDAGVLFDPGSIELKPETTQEFVKVADFIRLFSPAKVTIEGHTDSDGEQSANMRLSEQRALQITRYLVDEYTFITPAMVEAKGYGEAQPIVPNSTPDNKTLNRRIEVIVWE